MREYLEDASDVMSGQGTGDAGLSEEEAGRRLADAGPNRLREAERDPLWKRFFSQMADPMVLMLIAAAVQAGALDDAAVGGDRVPGLEDDDVARHDLR